MTVPSSRSDATVAGKALRADARRNRTRILDVARAAFAADGAAVQMDAIARQAGVGIGTLYRHFPTKEALVVELANYGLQRCVERAEADIDAPDAWAALEDFVFYAAQEMSRDVGLCNSLGIAPAVERSKCPEQKSRLMVALRALLDRTREQGVIRPDLTGDDFESLMGGLAGAIGYGGDWRRMSEVMLAGLRAQA